MKNGNSRLHLEYASLYSAPANQTVNPYTIKPGTEIIEILTGGRVIFTTPDGREELFGRGTIFWHIAGETTIHRFPPGEPYRCLAVLFRVPDDQPRKIPRVSHWPGDFDLDEVVTQAMRRSHDETIDRELWGDFFYRKLQWIAYTGNRRTSANTLPTPLLRATAAVKNARDSAFDVGAMAAAANISEAYLYALFKRHLNTSPHRYILNFRLRLARTRLADSDGGIKEIAEEAGFENLESFYRAFRRAVGMTPGEYRRSQQRPNY